MTKKMQKSQVSRRNILKFGAGVVGTGMLTAGVGSGLLSSEPAIAKENLTPDQAIDLLMAGNQRFATRKQKYPHQDTARLTEVAKGQKPFAAILGCADSRVPSEIVFDQGLGDLFVCRVAGNVAIDEEVGSLEFGTLVLGAKVIMVMGHERCGAVEATIKGAQVPGKIGTLLEAIRPALEQSPKTKADLEASIKANIRYQVEKLKASPVIAQLIQAGSLKVVGGYYDLDTGLVTRVG